MFSGKPECFEDGIFFCSLTGRHDHGVSQNQKDDADDNERDEVQERDDQTCSLNESLLECAFGFGLCLGAGVLEEVIHLFGNHRRLIRIFYLDEVPPHVTRPTGHFCLHSLIQVLPMEEELCTIDRLVSRLIDRTNNEFPLSGINVPLHRDNVSNLESILFRKICTQSARVALLLECLELIGGYDEFRIEIENCFGVDGHPGEKLRFVNVDAAKPIGIRDGLDARNLRDTIAISIGDGENKRHRITCDQPVRCRHLNAGIPGRYDSSEESKGHDGYGNSHDCEKRAKLVAQGVLEHQLEHFHRQGLLIVIHPCQDGGLCVPARQRGDRV